MEEQKQILNVWKKAVENYEDKKKKLCKKYKVKIKPIEADEYYTIFQFENGVQFTVPYDENYDDYDLTGDALKFAEKYNEIVQECYAEVDNNLEEFGFEKYDSDEFFNIWIKDNKEYYVVHYAKKEEDITVREIQGGGGNSSQP